tara:strand:+ start:173 stop:418 length:246 start_codon:yes stop_codon:yes gene_type:complete
VSAVAQSCQKQPAGEGVRPVAGLDADSGGRRRVENVWPQLLAITGTGSIFFGYALLRFRDSLSAARLGADTMQSITMEGIT